MRHADLLVLGNVLTADPSRPRAGGVACRGGVVVAVGERSEITSLGSNDTVVLDVGGGTVVPGFRDAHLHLVPLGRSFTRLDLHGLSLTSVLEAVVARAAEHGTTGWVEGAGWTLESMGLGRMPTAGDLSGACGDRPVLLHAHDFHSAVVNEAGLRVLPLETFPADTVERDDGGRPTGLLREAAVFRAAGLLRSEAGATGDRDAVRAAAAALLERGITSCDDMDGASTLRTLASMRRRGGLPLRVRCALRPDDLDTFERTGLLPSMEDEGLRVGGLKLFLDGALGSRTAWMLEDYADGPGRGRRTLTADEFPRLVARAAALGLPSLVHAIGDAAVREALTVLAAHGGLAHRVEHAQCVHPGDLPRFAEHHIAASMQPAHMHTDIPVATTAWGARGAHSFPLRSLLSAGATVLLGSDAPIEPADPLRWVHAATERTTAGGDPAGGWFPAERIAREDALRLAASTPLVAGAPADVVAYDEDLLAVEADRLLHIRPLHVRLGGAAPEALLARA